MRKIKRDIVSAVIVSSDEKILMGKKNEEKGGVYSDCWHLPGGGINHEESIENALKREVKEEVGIDISGYDMEILDDEGKGETEKTLPDGEKVNCQMNFVVYMIELDKLADEIKIILRDDLEEYRWFDFSDLNKVKLTPPSIELFKKIGYVYLK